ncbi:proline/serine-rich protein [Mycena pura]|uniref:Proline/serine-rich protein n=1 Tax=Mycena pura TaxID=153505 RepID=A0AAD6YTG4_9AGAR|nr:proline/serine-rich protein [Mycena pura]
MATAPPLPTATPTRSRDWPRTSEGSPFSGSGRGRGRSKRGRGAGGGGGGSASTSRTPATTSKPLVSDVPKPAVSGSGAAAIEQKSEPKPTTPSRSKNHGRRASRSAAPTVPTVIVDSSSPPAEVPSTTSRSSNRRRRSQQLSKGNASGLKVNVPAKDDNLLRPQNGLVVPHSAPAPSKDTPPHLGGSFGLRNNIDALVERVRAVAMDNRPTTPGSHIDWAGDDDEGLPDLDDWGVKTGPDKRDDTISPILVDGLKPLPEPVAKPPTTSDSAKEETVSPFIMETSPVTNLAPLHSSLPRKPGMGPSRSGRNNIATQKSTVKAAATLPDSSVTHEQPNPQTSEPSQPETLQQPRPDSGTAQDEDDKSDAGRDGLEASLHASTVSQSVSASSTHSTPSTQRRDFNLTHFRAQTVGRPFPQSAPVDFNYRLSHSGTSTPRGGYSSRNHHARTHSSPPAGSTLSSNHRPPHRRPVITGDAISRLARTIASSPSTRSTPISTTNN